MGWARNGLSKAMEMLLMARLIKTSATMTDVVCGIKLLTRATTAGLASGDKAAPTISRSAFTRGRNMVVCRYRSGGSIGTG